MLQEGLVEAFWEASGKLRGASGRPLVCVGTTSVGGVCVAAATATGPNQSVLTKKTSGEKLRKTNTLVDVLVCSVILKNV